MQPSFTIALVLGCLLVAAGAAAERREHGAHVHGRATMDVAALGGDVDIALRSPAMNIVGFEHEPRTDDDHERVRAALAALRDGAALFAFDAAPCRLEESEARWIPGGDHGHEAEHGDAGDHDDGHAGDATAHADIRVHYRFECDDAPAALRVRIFEHFPGTGEIRVQFLTDDGQGAATLTPAATVLDLE